MKRVVLVLLGLLGLALIVVAAAGLGGLDVAPRLLIAAGAFVLLIGVADGLRGGQQVAEPRTDHGIEPPRTESVPAPVPPTTQSSAAETVAPPSASTAADRDTRAEPVPAGASELDTLTAAAPPTAPPARSLAAPVAQPASPPARAAAAPSAGPAPEAKQVTEAEQVTEIKSTPPTDRTADAEKTAVPSSPTPEPAPPAGRLDLPEVIDLRSTAHGGTGQLDLRDGARSTVSRSALIDRLVADGLLEVVDGPISDHEVHVMVMVAVAEGAVPELRPRLYAILGERDDAAASIEAPAADVAAG